MLDLLVGLLEGCVVEPQEDPVAELRVGLPQDPVADLRVALPEDQALLHASRGSAPRHGTPTPLP